MLDNLYSQSWYRVADLRPRLRSHARIHRHIYRGEVWYVMQDQSTGRFHRFSPVANFLIGLMNGTRTLQEIWDTALLRLGSEIPPQEEVIKLLSDLHRADVLQSDVAPDIEELHRRRQSYSTLRVKQDFGNPMSLRFALVDPDRLLNRITPYLGWIMGVKGLLLWLCVVGYGLALCVTHWGALTDGMVDRAFIFYNLMLMAVLYPVIKILHEFGHAIAIKRAGGEVHEMGVMLLMMMPIPYVDASSSIAFRSKYQRMLTSAAGILVELFIAALAMIAWAHLTPGLPRALAYNAILITGVSTLVFNGNPLLRYDGYYILADYLEIPNLGQRANEYLGYLINHRLFGVDHIEPPKLTKGEGGWLIVYAIASFLYRTFITFSIVLMVAGQYFFVGVLLALWGLYSMLILPAVTKVFQMMHSPVLREKRVRTWSVLAAAALTALLVLVVIPFPFSTSVQGIVWAPEQALVRATVDAEVLRVVAKPMQLVHKGDVLIECADPMLEARVRQNQAELDELLHRYDANMATNRTNAVILQEQIDHARDVLQTSRQRLAELTIRSPGDGIFIIDTPEDFAGRFVQRGDLLAYVNDATDPTVRVVLQQDAEERVRTNSTRVEIRPADHFADVVQAKIAREVPAATDKLPSLTLSLQGGGNIGIDPSSQGDARAIERLFIMDLELPAGTHLSNLGGRIYVRFTHQPEPLAQQWYRSFRRLLLNRFNV